MNDLAFFDTNILVYDDDGGAPDKQARAVSLQVLQEYFVAAQRKLGMDAQTAQRKVEMMARARVVRFEVADVIAAIELYRVRQIFFGMP